MQGNICMEEKNMQARMDVCMQNKLIKQLLSLKNSS